MNSFIIPLVTALFIAACPGMLGPDDQLSTTGYSISTSPVVLTGIDPCGVSRVPGQGRYPGQIVPVWLKPEVQFPADGNLWIAALAGPPDPVPDPDPPMNRWRDQQGMRNPRPRIQTESGPPPTTVSLRDERSFPSLHLAA